MDSLKFKQERATIIENMEALVSQAKEEKRDLTDEETNEFDAFDSTIKDLDKKIDMSERLEELNKRIVSNFIVSNSGSGYQNKQRLICKVNTANNRIYIKNHGYLSGEIVQYSAGSNPLGALSSTAKYYIKKIDNDNFSLSLVGSGNVLPRYYYDNDVIVGYAATGDGSFNYEPITVEVKGVTGIGTTSDCQDFNCKIQPIFRGSIDSIDITSGGIGYGSSEVLNFNRQPVITLKSGKDAQLQPVVGNGKIVEVIIRSGGTEYNSPPTIVVESPEGKNAKLTPIITNGVITDVIIINHGIG